MVTAREAFELVIEKFALSTLLGNRPTIKVILTAAATTRFAGLGKLFSNNATYSFVELADIIGKLTGPIFKNSYKYLINKPFRSLLIVS